MRKLSDAQECTGNSATGTCWGDGKESIPVVMECAAVGTGVNDFILVTTADEP